MMIPTGHAFHPRYHRCIACGKPRMLALCAEPCPKVQAEEHRPEARK